MRTTFRHVVWLVMWVIISLTVFSSAQVQDLSR